jgi:N-acetylmuramoyl-L-alanine amidase
MRLIGKCSWFGGPNDIMGVAPDEGLAFIYDVSDAPDLFLPTQPPGTTGLARRLDPAEYYVACRWDYDAPGQSKQELLQHLARITATKTGMSLLAAPADWGPNANTGRIADLSPGLMEALGISTDDEVTVEYPVDQEDGGMTYRSIVISAGHSAKCIGAVGIIDEFTENCHVVNAVAEKLSARGVTVKSFIDFTSTTSNENLNKIVDYHNAQTRDLDVSIHFNANVDTSKPVGTECLYVTQLDLAAEISAAIASASGLIDRGPKERTDLFFLNHTQMPAVLIEVAFVDSSADVEIYRAKFDQICEAIADVLGGEQVQPVPPRPPRPEEQVVEVDINVPAGVRLALTVNGEDVMVDDD